MNNNRKPHILQLIRTLDIAGAEKYGLEIARALPKDQFTCSVCAFFQRSSSNEAYWQAQLEKENIYAFSTANWHPANRLAQYISGFNKLKQRLDKAPVDLIHSHFSMGTMMALALRKQGLVRKVVRTAHGQSQYEWSPRWYSKPWRWFVYNYIYPWFLDAESGVSTPIFTELRSPARLKRIKNHPPSLIYNGIPQDFIDAAHPTTLDHKNTYRIGSVGRLSAQKGFSYLINAMPLVLSQLPSSRLEIVGDGELKAQLQGLIQQLNLAEHVTILDKHNNIIPFLQQLDLFVLPSLWEGFPTVVLESMASGTPVLATDIPGTNELIQNGVTGWLVKPADPVSLAEGIVRGLNSRDELQKLRANALSHVKNFSFDKIAAQFRDLYLSLLDLKAK